MTTKEMKKVVAEELLSHIETAKTWEQKWIEADRDDENYEVYERLMDSYKSQADALLTLMKRLGWIDEEQRCELYSDMLEEIYAD